MRKMIFLLLLLNVALLSWRLLQPLEEDESKLLTTQQLSTEIRLLSEVSESELKVGDSIQARDSQLLASLSQGRAKLEHQCLRIGPFDSPLTQRWAQTVLQLHHLESHFLETDKARTTGIRLVLGPFESRDIAFETIQLLREHRLDGYLVNDGDEKNSIQVATFDSAASAEFLIEKLSRLGLDAEIMDNQEKTRAYWLTLSYSQALAHTKPLWQHLQASFPGVSRSAIACDSAQNHVAVRENFE